MWEEKVRGVFHFEITLLSWMSVLTSLTTLHIESNNSLGEGGKFQGEKRRNSEREWGGGGGGGNPRVVLISALKSRCS